MTDRANSPVYQMLPRSARRVFAAIERAIGDRSSASVSHVEFRLDHNIVLKAVNVFRFSNRWRTTDEVEAVRLAELAREVKPRQTFEKQREPKPVKPAPKPMAVERPRVMQRRVPSLPTMPWHDDGR